MTSVIVLYAKASGPVVGVLAPVGPVQVPTLPPGRTFQLPVLGEVTDSAGTAEAVVPVAFRSDEIAVASIDSTETDPLALFRFGVKIEQSPTTTQPQPVLEPLLSAGITITAPAAGGTTIKGTIKTAVAGEPLDIELWGADGRVAVVRVLTSLTVTDFQFTNVLPGTYAVLVRGFVPEAVTVKPAS